MNKSELATFVSQATGLKNTEATKAVDAVLEAVAKTLSKGNEVRLVGFGSFVITERAAREGRNPKTGETLKIPATKAVRFKPGKDLRDTINK